MIIGYCIIAYLAHLVLVYFSSCVGTGITVMIMNRLVVKEDNYESFIMDVYNRCNNLGITPENIDTLESGVFSNVTISDTETIQFLFNQPTRD
jgi:hypothetical protein